VSKKAKKYKISNTRITAIGDYVYYDTFNVPVRYGYEQEKSVSAMLGKRDALVVRDEEACVRSSRKLMRQIITANAGQYRNEKGEVIPTVLMTLTIAENIQDLSVANRKFHDFIKRYGYLTKAKLAYLGVPEHQERGAVHYHVLFFNLPYVPNIHEATTDCWREGFIFGTTQGDIQKVTNYLLKYVQKSVSVGQQHEKNKRRFLTSKGLKRPLSSLDEEVARTTLINLPKPKSIKHVEFTDHEGRKTNRMILHLPKDTNVGRFIPQDTAKLAKKMFGGEDADG
jgi:hypothetical protein